MRGGNNPHTVSVISDLLVQLDGNLSISSADLDNSLNASVTDNDDTLPQIDKIFSASYLPVTATYNARSLLSKIKSFKNLTPYTGGRNIYLFNYAQCVWFKYQNYVSTVYICLFACMNT